MRRPEEYKETYKLWVDFLRESHPYEEYCEKHRKSKQLNPDEIYWTGKTEVYDFDYREPRESEPLRDAKENLSKVFRFFGDIHAPDYGFEVWWENVVEGLLKEHKADPYIVNKIDCFEIAHNIVDDYGETLDKPATAEQVLGVGLHELLGEEKGSISLKVNAFHSTDELVERFREMIEGHKKNYGITPDIENDYITNLLPVIATERLASELGRYLEVYQLRKRKVKWIDIIRPRDPDSIKTETTLKGRKIERIADSARRSYRYYVTRAEAIIRNTEMNIFPGEY